MTLTSIAQSKIFQLLSDRKVAQRILEGCILLTLVVTTIGQRSMVASQRRIMPAGDVFNFQSIARNIRHWQYPSQEKRLPGFPLVLLVGMELGFDPTLTGITISIVSSGATVGLLYLLGRRFKFPALPLALCLLLCSISPLLTINGVRPLSDSFFLFLVILSVYLTTIVRPTKKSALLTGFVLMYLAFTRYEGIPTAGMLLLLLWIRIPWRLVLLAALPLVVAGLLWLPVAKKIHGSLQNFGYFRDAQEIASIEKVPREYRHIVESSGFGRAWQIQDLWAEDKQAQADAHDLLYNPTWWLSVLGSFGVLWLIFFVRKQALPLLIEFAFYPILPAWWFTYSRYVAPMSAFYLFAVAAGVTGIWVIARYIVKPFGWPGRFIAAVVLCALLVKIMLGVIPGMQKEALARGLENNGNGYSLYMALQSLRKTDDKVAVSFDYLMAYMMFGMASYPKDGLNEGRGIYLSAKPEASPEELAQYIHEQGAEVLVDNGEKEIKALVEYLQEHNNIARTQSFTWPRQDKNIDTTYLHYLHWQQ